MYAVVKNVPVCKYVIEVSGNTVYEPSTKSVNIINEEDNLEIIVYIGLSLRVDSNVEFCF